MRIMSPASRGATRRATFAAIRACAALFFCRISPRPIRIRLLHPSQDFHTGPIYLVVFKGSYLVLPSGTCHLEGGFALRCIQRLSRPDLATQRCTGRHNWNTSGRFIPVLSY